MSANFPIGDLVLSIRFGGSLAFDGRVVLIGSVFVIGRPYSKGLCKNRGSKGRVCERDVKCAFSE